MRKYCICFSDGYVLGYSRTYRGAQEMIRRMSGRLDRRPQIIRSVIFRGPS